MEMLTYYENALYFIAEMIPEVSADELIAVLEDE